MLSIGSKTSSAKWFIGILMGICALAVPILSHAADPATQPTTRGGARGGAGARAGGGAPATPAYKSYEVLPDRQVTFRIAAPNATTVSFTSPDTSAGPKAQMKKTTTASGKQPSARSNPAPIAIPSTSTAFPSWISRIHLPANPTIMSQASCLFRQ